MKRRKSITSIRIRYEVPVGSGRRRGWGKVVTSVDTTKTNGYAFEGEFLGDGEVDLPLGTVIVEKYPAGSVKNSYWQWTVGRVSEAGEIEHETADGKSEKWAFYWEREQFLSFRDRVAELVDGPRPESDVERWTRMAGELGFESVDAAIAVLKEAGIRPGQ